MIRAEVKFVGRVQGVGFRYTTHRIAQQFAVTGLVRNESDGSVYLCVEGERKEIESLINQVRTEMTDFIREVSVHWTDASGKWSRFSIETS